MIGRLKKFFHIDQIYPASNKCYLSVVTTIKNEAPYLKEWLEYHKMLGVERFYIYDNESDDNTFEILKSYIQDGSVVYNYIRGKGIQMNAYKDAIYHYKNETFWMAFIDLDEFIVPVEEETIPQLLQKYEQYSGVAINWLTFDCNNHETKPDGLVIENYTRTKYDLKMNLHVKCIVQPKYVQDTRTAHRFIMKFKNNPVNSNFKHVNSNESKVAIFDKIRINHYYIKSKEEYLQRVAKGDVFNDKKKRKIEYELLNCGDIQDTLITDKYLSNLKERLNQR